MADFDGKHDGKHDDHDDQGGGGKMPDFAWMPAGCVPLADGEYDAIIMGTGLTECIIAGLLSVQGKRVLHLDRNNYYGAETASLSLHNLYAKFRGSEAPSPALGHSRDWNVDLVPKFIMACGKLVKILLHTKVTRYLEFKSVDGSYVFNDGKVQKVPATPAEALNSSLMGFFEKRKFRNFLMFLSNYDKNQPSTYLKGKTLDKVTMRQVYEEYGLDPNTQAFTGHAMALQVCCPTTPPPTVQPVNTFSLSLHPVITPSTSHVCRLVLSLEKYHVCCTCCSETTTTWINPPWKPRKPSNCMSTLWR